MQNSPVKKAEERGGGKTHREFMFCLWNRFYPHFKADLNVTHCCTFSEVVEIGSFKGRK